MTTSFFYNKYLILFLSIFSHMMLNIIGEVSPSFLFIFITSPWWFKWRRVKHDFIQFKFVKFVLALIVLQCLWALFHSYTDIMTQIKGIMITVSGLLMFLYYYFAVSRNHELVKWYVLGTFIASFIFIDMIALREAIIIEEYSLWKFQIYPRIVVGTVCFYLFFRKNIFIKQHATLVFVMVGMLGLATGSRSAGLVPLISGVIVFMIGKVKKLNLKKIGWRIVVGIVLLYMIYAFGYVPKVMDGSISGGNTEQLKRAENPYNPINLLMVGRSDSVVPFLAFLDKPILGWGYNTKDPNFKYHEINAKLSVREFRIDFIQHEKIPGHSILGTYSCSYGIIACLILLSMMKIIFKKYVSYLRKPNDILLYVTFLMMDSLWTLLFNPISSFKLTWTISLAFILVLCDNRKQVLYGKEKIYLFYNNR